jgi:hypothetical protein
VRGRWTPHLVAAAVTIPFAIWIATSDIQGVLSPTAWLLPLAAAYYLGLRIGREVVRGIRRARSDEPSGRWMTSGDPADDDDEIS